MLGIGRTLRDARRTREILSVLVRYGFRNVVEELHLEGALRRALQRTLGRPVDPTVEAMPLPQRLRMAMEELGPTFVKLGQVLSLRPDLIPPDWATEFSKLHATVAPVPFVLIRERLVGEFGPRFDEVFESIEETPIAAASMAQVHRAVGRCGTRVVLKILRPDAERIVAADMDILKFLAGFVEHRFKDLAYSPTEVVREFAEELSREVDLEHEGRSCDRFNELFHPDPHAPALEGVAASRVRFPRVHWKMTTRRVLAMDEVRGTLLSTVARGDWPKDRAEQVVSVGADAVFRMCLEFGFFHADPHPGNIFAREDGSIVFIDCGMTGQIDPGTAAQLADLVQGVVTADLDTVLDVVVGLSDADPAIVNDRAFRADVWEFIGKFQGATLAKLDLGRMLEEFFEKVRKNRLRVPSDIVFLIKAITTIEGVGERLAPEFDLVTHVRPHIERLVKRQYGFGALRRRLKRSMLGYVTAFERLPSQLRSVFYAFRRDRFTINLEHRGLDTLTETIRAAAGQLASAIFVAALLLGGAVLMLADSMRDDSGHLALLAWIGFGFAVFFTAWRLISSRFR